MAKTEFRATIDGEGKVRFFVDGGSHTIDEYIAKYIKVHGKMPEIPVGLGGRAADPPVAMPDPAEPSKEEQLQAENEVLKARLAALEAEDQIPTPDAPPDLTSAENNDGEDDGA